MGIVRKPKVDDYWSGNEFISTPFFKKYMSRNRFQLILSNLHLRDENIAAADKKRDKLYKLRPLMDMLEANFQKYRPEKDISLDEGGCPFKGRVAFKTYNPAKLNRFAIKTYQVCEASSGYCVAFDVYTGTDRSWSINASQDNVAVTTRTVLDTLNKANCLGQGYHVYMDNYYNSPELCEELSRKKTGVCGTIKANRKGLPKAITRNLKNLKKKKNKGECIWHRKSNMLALVWMDKRTVFTISTIHSAKMVNVKHNFRGEIVQKPRPVVDYTKHMFGVDLSDQLLAYYSLLRKSVKWWRKLAIHLVNLAILNAYIVYKKANPGKSHVQFRLELVQALIDQGLPTCTETPAQVTPRRTDHHKNHLVERHFPELLKPKTNARKAKPYRRCNLCKGWTRFWCPDCRTPFCAAPCFGTYHKTPENDEGEEGNDMLDQFDDLATPLVDNELEHDIDIDVEGLQDVTLTDLNVSELERQLGPM